MFLIPTMAHGVGGYQLTEFDPFRALVSWVERGTLPDRIIATTRNARGHQSTRQPGRAGGSANPGGTGGVPLRRCGPEAVGDFAGLG